jgi:hypothetical protein
MTTTVDAMFDGEVFWPTQPVELEPNTAVKLTVETAATSEPHEHASVNKGMPYSFFDVLKSMEIDGPPDWSANVDKYLYGHLYEEEEQDGDV